MRSTTTQSQANALSRPQHISTHLRVSVDDGNGTFADLTNLRGYNWVDSVSYSMASGEPLMTAMVQLKRDAHKLSLAPFVDGSILNASGAVIDITRAIKIETAVLPMGKSPNSDEWEVVFEGRIRAVRWASNPITLECADNGYKWVRRFIETQLLYAETDNLLHEVVQDIVDDNDPDVDVVAANYTWNGTTTITTTDTTDVEVGDFVCYQQAPYFEISAIVPNTSLTILNPISRTIKTGSGAGSSVWIPGEYRTTLYVEGSNPTWAIKKYYQSKDKVMTAVRNLAQQIGYEVSYRWNTSTGAFELTLWAPDRSKSTPDATIGKDVYDRVSALSIDDSNIRNRIKITAETVASGRTTVVREDFTSQAKYGILYMEATEGSSSQIDTVTEMQAMGDAILDDLKEPDAELSMSMPYRWDLQLGDLLRIEANAAHFDTDQDLAPVRIRHQLNRDGRSVTSITARGRPSGGVMRWLELEGLPGVAPPVDLKTDSAAENVVIEAVPGGIIVTYDDPRTMDPPIKDWAYTECHVSTSTGFTPSGSTLKAKGKVTRFEVGGLIHNETYYAKLIIYDEVGNKAAITTQVVKATQYVASYHETPEQQRHNMVPNGDFGQSSFDITTTPPDSWTSVFAWGSSLDVYYDATKQQTGKRSLRVKGRGPPYASQVTVLGGYVPVSDNVFYKIETALQVDTAGEAAWVGLAFFDKDKAFLGSSVFAGGAIAAANTWYQYNFYRYVTDLSSGTRYVKPYISCTDSASAAFYGYFDRFVLQEGHQFFDAYRSSAQSVASTAFTKIQFNAQTAASNDFDSTTNHRYTVRQTGEYDFHSRVGLDALADQKKVFLMLYVNGVSHVRGVELAASGSNNVSVTVSSRIQLVAGDYVEVFLYHNHGSNRNTGSGSTVTWFSGKRVG